VFVWLSRKVFRMLMRRRQNKIDGSHAPSGSL
jgi:hypothetical protein